MNEIASKKSNQTEKPMNEKTNEKKSLVRMEDVEIVLQGGTLSVVIVI